MDQEFSELADITPLTDTITINGKTIKVNGVMLKDLVSILVNFPEVRGMIAAKVLDVNLLIAKAPDAVAALIAAACGKHGDRKTIASAAALPVGSQAEFLDKIYGLSFPNGIAPLVEMFERLEKGPGGAAIQKTGQDGLQEQHTS